MTPRINSSVSSSTSSSQSLLSEWANGDVIDDDSIINDNTENQNNFDQDIVVVDDDHNDDSIFVNEGNTALLNLFSGSNQELVQTETGSVISMESFAICTHLLSCDVPVEIVHSGVNSSDDQNRECNETSKTSRLDHSQKSVTKVDLEDCRCNNNSDFSLGHDKDDKHLDVNQTTSNRKGQHKARHSTVLQEPFSCYFMMLTYFICLAYGMVLWYLLSDAWIDWDFKDSILANTEPVTRADNCVCAPDLTSISLQIKTLHARIDSLQNNHYVLYDELLNRTRKIDDLLQSTTQPRHIPERVLDSNKIGNKAVFVVEDTGTVEFDENRESDTTLEDRKKVNNFRRMDNEKSMMRMRSRKKEKINRKMNIKNMRDERRNRRKERTEQTLDLLKMETNTISEAETNKGMTKPDTSDLSYIKKLFIVELWDNEPANVLYAIREIGFELKDSDESRSRTIEMINNDIGGFSTLAGAIRKWYYHEEIQLYGIECLHIILKNEWYKFSSVARNTDFINIVLTATKNFPSNDSLQGLGCEALFLFSRGNGRASQPGALALEIVNSTIEAMKTHPSNTKVQRYSSQILYNLSQWDILRKTIRKLGGVKALKKMSKFNSRIDPETQKWITYALRRLD